MATRAQHLRVVCALLVAAALCLAWAQPAWADADQARRWPVSGPVVRTFDPPDQPWLAGHRGIDIAAPAGTPVVSAAAGVVTWTGSIGGVPMITVTHTDGLRTTYQPVDPLVAPSTRVEAGQQIGVLRAGPAVQDCLHLGLLRGDAYLDPLAWLGGQRPASGIRLLPDDTQLAAPDAGAGTALLSPTANGWPVVGPITSPYGWRTDPITGARSFHSGTDIAAACGTPVAAPLAGTVIDVRVDPSLGNYVTVAHADELRTTYGHLSRQLVTSGQPVAIGQVLGLVGTTGRSTGCHLHFGATRNGVSIDSRPLLP